MAIESKNPEDAAEEPRLSVQVILTAIWKERRLWLPMAIEALLQIF